MGKMINCEICGKKTHERSGNILDDGRFVCVFCEQDLDPISEMLEGKTLEQLNELEKKTNDSIEDMETYLKTLEDQLSDLDMGWSAFHRTVKEKLQASDLISEIQEKKGRILSNGR